MRVEWGIAGSPHGPCSVGWSDRGVCHLAFCDRAAGVPCELRAAWPKAGFRRNDRAAEKRAREIFAGKPGTHITAHVRGTAFQLKVWRALLRIPSGRVLTYSEIASAIGSPGAARAVGGACGANPVAWIIPCHRVVRAAGNNPGGYRWGAEKKRAILAAESAGSRA